MKLILVSAISLTLISGGAVAQTDCRTLGTLTHCFSPPAPQPLTGEQEKALRDALIQQERAVLAPLAPGPSITSCAAATRNAELARRWDLIKLVQGQCIT